MPERLISRNRQNVHRITRASFWINDVKQEDGSLKIEIAFSSEKGWLHIQQEYGNECKLFPIDGVHGVFRKAGLEVQHPDDFLYDWTTIDPRTGGLMREQKPAGDCDCLIILAKWFFFEFKTSATSSLEWQINNNTGKAEAQLAKSLTSFREKLDEQFRASCIVVTPKIYPKTNASMSTRALKFKVKYGAELNYAHVDEAYRVF